MKKLTNKGFTLLESLFSLFIISISMSLLINIYPIIIKINDYEPNIDEEIAIKQLQEVILLGKDFLFDQYELRFYYMGKDVTLKIDKNRIVKTDGYVIYLENIDNAYFSEEKSCFFLNYNNKKRFLGCE